MSKNVLRPKGRFKAAGRIYLAVHSLGGAVAGVLATGEMFDDLLAFCGVTATQHERAREAAAAIAADPSLLIPRGDDLRSPIERDYPGVPITVLNNDDLHIPPWLYGLRCRPFDAGPGNFWHEPARHSSDLLVYMLCDWWRRRTGSHIHRDEPFGKDPDDDYLRLVRDVEAAAANVFRGYELKRASGPLVTSQPPSKKNDKAGSATPR